MVFCLFRVYVRFGKWVRVVFEFVHESVLMVWKGFLDCVWKVWMLGWGKEVGDEIFWVILGWECKSTAPWSIECTKVSTQEQLGRSLTKGCLTECNPNHTQGSSVDARSTEQALFQVLKLFHGETSHRESGKSLRFWQKISSNI